MKKVLLCGVGRMGKRIAALLADNDALELVGAIESDGSELVGKDVGEASGLGKSGVLIFPASKLEKVILEKTPDVLIDFTHALESEKTARIACNYKVRLVIGTTGFSKEQLEGIQSIAEKSKNAVVLSPNMSVGVNAFFRLCEQMAGTFRDYDTEIIEVHHNLKKDAPSGTALRIAEIIAKAQGSSPDDFIFGRKGNSLRKKGEVCIHSVRSGDVVGEHTVVFAGNSERIELVHKAHSRDAFASGAILAAEWLVSQPPGFYGMQDVLASRR